MKPTQDSLITKYVNERVNTLVKLLIFCLPILAFNLSAEQITNNKQHVIYLDEAVRYTLDQHPDLKSFTYMKNSSEALIKQAKVASPMTISAGVEDALGTGTYSGLSSMQTTLSLSWLLEQNLIDSRVNVATNKSKLSDFLKQEKRLSVAAETARVFITLLSQKQQFKLAKLAKLQAKTVLDEISNRVKMGKLNIIDQLRAKADLSKKKLVLEDLEHEILASKAQLAAQWQGDLNFVIDGSLATTPSLHQINEAYEKLKSHPKLRAISSQKTLIESEIELAKTQQTPAWSVKAGLKRNEARDGFSFTAGVSIPLGSDNRNQGKIAALQEKKNQQTAESDAWFKRMSTQVLLLSHKLKHNRHVIEALSTETIPALELANKKAKQAYEIGRYSYTDLYAIQQDLLESQNELIQAYTHIHLFNIELERLTGASIQN